MRQARNSIVSGKFCERVKMLQIPQEIQLSRSLYDIAPLLPVLEQGYTVLTPNHRLARRVKLEWDSYQSEAGARVWPTEPVFSVQSWLEQQCQLALSQGVLPPLHLLASEQETQLWRQTIESGAGADAEFTLLQPEAAADLAATARHTLLQWGIDTQRGAWRAACEHEPDCAAFLRWLDDFEQSLQARGQTTLLDCIAQLSAQPAHGASVRVALLECGEIPPLYASAIRRLCTEVVEVEPEAGAGDRRVYAFDSHAGQLQAVANWVAASHRQNPDVSIGVVLMDMRNDRQRFEYQLRRAFDCLGENYANLAVNFSTGMPLAATPVVRDGLLALEMGLNDTTVPAVVKVLGSRFLALDDALSPLAQRFINGLHAEGMEHLSVARLRVSAAQVKLGDEQGLALGDILMKMARLRHLGGRALPGEWAGYFLEILELWGWPGPDPLDSLEYQQVASWYELFEGLRAFDAVSAPLDYAAALSLLRETTRNRMSQPESADSNIQVLGPLEAVGLQFDHLWLVGVQASRWPEPPRPNPLLPGAMQAQLGMPRATAQREWEIAERRMAQYRRSVGVLHAGYTCQVDGISESPSALLADFVPGELPAPSLVPPQWVDAFASRRLETIDDDQGPPLASDATSGRSGGSGLLEDQSQCPFRAFARRRLKVEPLGEFTLALSPAERGSIVHHALDALWGRLVDHARLVAMDNSEIAQAVADAAQEGLARAHKRRHGVLATTYWDLERKRLEGLLMQWLELERSRTAFVVLAREKKVTLTLGQLALEMRIDRIDELPDGSQLILDYKSSASSIKEWMGERPAKPQLLLYGVASPDAASGLAFAQVRPQDCKFVGLGTDQFAPGIRDNIAKAVDKQMAAQTWDELNALWAEILKRLAQDFIDGRAQVDPLSAKSCTWCGLQPLCRIDASGNGGALSDSDDDSGESLWL